MKLKLLRYSTSANSTLGILFIDDLFECYTIEDTFREKKVAGKTRIPAGQYEIKLNTECGYHHQYQEKFPDIHKGMLHIQDVPNFSYILIHIGNHADNTEGCLLVGYTANNNKLERGFVGSSTTAYTKMYPKVANALLEEKEVTIEIQDVS